MVSALAVLFNAVTADTIDYAELRMGQRNEGIITSTRTFVTKVATAIAGTVCALALDWIGYVPNAVQAESVKQALHGVMSLVPALLYGTALVIMLFYPLDKQSFSQLQ